jgi:hypothetical protein
MKIKNVEELANVLGMAFRTYSATVATGRNIEPFLPLIDGHDGVTVFIMLSGNGEISIRAPAVEPIVIAKPVTCEELGCNNVSVIDAFEQAKEVEEPVLEAEPEETVTEKPKRKRRTI